MGFWGIEVKPGKPYPYHSDNIPGTLHVTQATLGIGSSTENSILQCATEHKSPVFLCSLLPGKMETCALDLKFDEEDLVAFTVLGSRSIHLSGYFVADDPDDHLRDDYGYESDSLGEDISGTESDESSDFDSEDDYGDDFIEDDSDFDMFPSSPVPNSGVIIEEIEDEPKNGDDLSKPLKKKEQLPRLKEKDSKGSQLPIVKKGENDLVLESEDEDGFPLSTAGKSKPESQKAESEIKGEPTPKRTSKDKKKVKDVDHSASLKRKVESADEDEQLQDGKKKKKNKLKDQGKGERANASGNSNETNVNTPVEKHNEEVKTATDLNISNSKDGHDGKLSNSEVPVEKKNKKKKKKTKESEGVAAGNQVAAPVEKQNLSTTEKKGKEESEAKPSNIRTFANGLVIEDLSMGKPDGKRATPGAKVSVKYIGKLKKNGTIFDSNVGKYPFKFRLGVGAVIKGWDVGVNGMRVGDKRRITIPPSMGYGDKRVGSIPANSWLVFDVELVGVGR